MTHFDIVLFDGFETLDAMGPAEIIGHVRDAYAIGYFSRAGGVVQSAQGLRVDTRAFAEIAPGGVLLVPGGMGTRALVKDAGYLAELTALAARAAKVLAVCTGSALLAAGGFLNGRRATSNKRAFAWARSVGAEVLWVARARWVRDGYVYTSSGVSAGMDMALGFLADELGEDAARQAAWEIEYLWNADPDDDPFSGDTE